MLYSCGEEVGRWELSALFVLYPGSLLSMGVVRLEIFSFYIAILPWLLLSLCFRGRGCSHRHFGGS